MTSVVIAVPFWNTNAGTKSFSSMYDESWVEKLYRGIKRHCTVPFEFVCFTERDRVFSEPITVERFTNSEPSYADCLEPYRLGRPMMLMGLDTVITGNIDHLARYCLESDKLAVPRDPFFPQTVCNGVALVPAGHDWVWDEWPANAHRFTAYSKDMDWIRSINPAVIDDIWPGSVVSYKGHAKTEGVEGVSIVYFHGEEKMNDDCVGKIEWVKKNWF